jgi:hypothetical protein
MCLFVLENGDYRIMRSAIGVFTFLILCTCTVVWSVAAVIAIQA